MRPARALVVAAASLVVALCTAASLLPRLLPHISALVALAIVTRVVWFYTGRW